MDRLKGKVAIITGSGAGMGKATALLFAREGAKVAVTCRTPEAGQAVVQQIRAEGGEAEYFRLDVAKEANCSEVIEKVVEKWGKLDILINNAGIVGSGMLTEDVTEEDMDKVFGIDIKGVMFMTKHAIPQMRKNGKGAIVNFSSTYATAGNFEATTYHVAKGAVMALTKQDAVNYGPEGIRVNCVNPCLILTPMCQQCVDRDPAYKEKQMRVHPMGFGQPEQVAYAVLFLASDEASLVNGASLFVDGGYTAQ